MLPPLNQLGLQRCDALVREAFRHRVAVSHDPSGTRLVDCGVNVEGGLQAGRALAEISLAGLGRVQLFAGSGGPSIAVHTDHPVTACMAAQYAGWPISVGKYFAMGSGPMRAARGQEKLLEHLGHRENPESAVGVLETRRLPDESACRHIAAACGVDAGNLTLLVAPTASLAGTVQVVARTVETALHKLHELEFDLSCIVSGFGTAPLPPIAADDLAGIGRTNDAVLYGGEVTLWVRTEDERLTEIGPRVPSSASSDYGRPFSEIFDRYERDFYRIDPLLFSPAVVRFNNLASGNVFEFGELNQKVLQLSFRNSTQPGSRA